MAKPDFFATFRARWKLAVDAEQDQRQNELEDLRFEAGDHWDASVKREREKQGKMCLTIDLISGPVKQVTNQQRTARPGITISPVGNGADAKKAERWQGIVRRVERLSQASRAYSWAGQHQAKMGRGFWVLRNVEVGDDGEQDIRIEEVDNQHTWYCDPTSRKLDGSDKKWAIGYQDLTHEDYIARFGESKLADALADGQFLGGDGISPPEWITSTHARIAEYFYREETKRTRLILSDGSRVWEDEQETESGRNERGRFSKDVKLPPGVTIQRRVVKKTAKVHWCLLNGMGEKLEDTTVPGEFIPVVMVYGERRNIDGKVDFRGLVRMAKDPSRMEDWAESSLMEAISEAKSAPWLAEWDQISEFSSIWQSRLPVRVLPYKKVSGDNGAPLPPPQRVQSGVDVSALTLAAQRMENHVRRTTGIPDTFNNETSSEQSQLSGRAILARRAQQELGTSDYLENLGDGIVLTAKIIMSMARDGVYDTPRLMRITGEDEKEHEIVTHDGPDQQDAARQLQTTRDIEDLFDLSVGEYDIAISAGKNYQTGRQESVEAVGAAIQAYPQIAPIALPILFKNSDWPGALEIANALDPNKGQDIPPQVKQHLQQADQLLQMAQQRIQELEQEKQADVVKGQTQQAIAQAKNQATLQKTQMDNETKIAVAELGAKVDRLALFLEERGRIGVQQHEVSMAAADAAHQHEQANREDLRLIAGMGQDKAPSGNGAKPKA